MIFKNGFTAGRFGESSACAVGSALTFDTGFGRATGVLCVAAAPLLVVGDGAFLTAGDGAFFVIDFVATGLEPRLALVGVVPNEKLPCVEVKS